MGQPRKQSTCGAATARRVYVGVYTSRANTFRLERSLAGNSFKRVTAGRLADRANGAAGPGRTDRYAPHRYSLCTAVINGRSGVPAKGADMKPIIAAIAAVVALSMPAAAAWSPDGNTATFELLNSSLEGSGWGGASGARTAWWTTILLNDGSWVSDTLIDTGAMGVCIAQPKIDAMRSGEDRLSGKPTLFASDYRGRVIIETASGQKLVRDQWNIHEVRTLGFILYDVVVTTCGDASLLGQGILARFKSWSIDNQKGTITVVGPPANGCSLQNALQPRPPSWAWVCPQ